MGSNAVRVLKNVKQIRSNFQKSGFNYSLPLRIGDRYNRAFLFTLLLSLLMEYAKTNKEKAINNAYLQYRSQINEAMTSKEKELASRLAGDMIDKLTG